MSTYCEADSPLDYNDETFTISPELCAACYTWDPDSAIITIHWNQFIGDQLHEDEDIRISLTALDVTTEAVIEYYRCGVDSGLTYENIMFFINEGVQEEYVMPTNSFYVTQDGDQSS